MNSIQSPPIFFALFLTTCLARIAVEETDRMESNLAKTAVKVLRSCYGNRVTPVGLAGTSAGIIAQSLWSQEASPATLIDGTTRVVNNARFNSNFRYKLEVFVVSASSAETLRETLRHIKSSLWWNHMAAFLILHVSSSNHGCSNAFNMLWTVWDKNILNATLFCHDRSNEQWIYTFNPYTNRAPEKWLYHRTYRGKNNHRWTLFVRKYGRGDNSCEELNFDKTKDLGGYEIRISTEYNTRHLSTEHRNSRFNVCSNPHSINLCSIILPALNATPNVKLYPPGTSLGYVDDRGNPDGILADVFHGVTDVGINRRYLTTMKNLTASYPITQSDLRSLTRYSGYMSQFRKIHGVIDDSSRCGLYIVVLITIVFFKLCLRQSIVVAHLNTFRLICNSTLPTVPGNVGPRIYLGSFFLFALTLHGIFQGMLASLLTNPKPLANVNTMRDLAELSREIYGLEGYRRFFHDPVFEDRFFVVKNLTECTRHVLQSGGSACVGGLFSISYEAANHTLHVSREALASTYKVLPIRPDWPLEHRLNAILMRSLGGHLLAHLQELALAPTRRKLKIQEYKYEAKGVKVMTVEQLRFAFVILGIGLGIASVVFLIEVKLRQRRLRMVGIINRIFCHRS